MTAPRETVEELLDLELSKDGILADIILSKKRYACSKVTLTTNQKACKFGLVKVKSQTLAAIGCLLPAY
jgi:hypothetical protein